MKVIFSKTLIKKEKIEGRKTEIAKAYSKNIFRRIKGENLPKDSELIKIYTTSIQGAGRLVFLVNVKTKDGFFLFYRSKNDEIGKNISIKNSRFKMGLKKYLLILKGDIQNRNYEVIETEAD